MSSFSFEVTPTEILGYASGITLAVAWLPQVIHALRTWSTKDIAYGWQLINIIGLTMDSTYYFLSNTQAAFVTCNFELTFSLVLLFLKISVDGVDLSWLPLGDKHKRLPGFFKKFSTAEELSETEESEDSAGTIEIRCSTSDSSSKYDSEDELDVESTGNVRAKQTSRITIDLNLDDGVSEDFVRNLLSQISELAASSQVNVIRHDTADDSKDSCISMECDV